MTKRQLWHPLPSLLVVALVALGLVAASSPSTARAAATTPVTDPPAAAPTPSPAPGPAAAAATPPPVADDRLVVGLEPDASPAEASAIAQDAGVSGAQVIDDHTIVVDPLAGGIAAPQATRLRDDHRVKYVEPNYRISGAFVPNDPTLPSLGGLRNAQPGGIRAEAAWDTTLGSRGVVVGVLDSGIDASHPDLVANLWNNRIGIGGCGYGTHGYDAFTRQCTTADPYGHGTHVSGILGAVGNNGIGITGVAPRVSLMSLTMLDRNGNGSIAGAVAAIDWAVKAKNAGVNLRVLSASWGGDGFSQGLADAIQRAGAAGILFVTAAGNDTQDIEQHPVYPCAAGLANVVCVASSGDTDHLSAFSDFGAAHVDLAAPGEGIVSTVPPGVIPGCGASLYCSLDGTSMAAPMVTGAAALAVAAQPTLSVAALRSVIVSAVDAEGSLSGKVASGGRLDVCKAVPGCGLVAKPPTAPTAVQVSVVHGQATVAWSPPDSNGNKGPLTGYQVTGPDGVHSIGAGTRSFTVSGLVDNQDAQLSVQARNAVGLSPASLPVVRSLSGGFVAHQAGRLARVVVSTGSKPSTTTPTDLAPADGQARGVAVLPSGTGGYLLDQFGGLHPFGIGDNPPPPPATGARQLRTGDWARGVAITPDGRAGYVLDGNGNLYGFSIGDNPRPPSVTGGPHWSTDLGRGVAIAPSGTGGYLADEHGSLYRFSIGGGALPAKQSKGIAWPGQDMVRGLALVRGGTGGFVLDRSGGLHPFKTGGPAPARPTSGPPWPGLDRARGLAF